MKRSTAPSIDRIVRLSTGAAASLALALALALAFSSTACATAPATAPADAPPADASAPAGSPVAESFPGFPSASDARRAPPPSERVVAASLAEPVVSSPTIAAAKPALPTDITVLSSEPSLTAAAALAGKAFALPEPAPPKPEAALIPQKPASAAAAPVLPAPEAKKAGPAKPAPAAAPKAAAAPKPAAAPTPKPAAAPAAAEDKKPAETPAYTDPKPAVVLPASPASSARSVDPTGGKPVAETRIETVRGERFELRFPGTGWLYLGDEEGKEGLKYETRRFEDTQAVFALNPEAEGEYVLRFQRQNPVDRSTEVSLVRVVVKEKAAASAAAVPAVSAPGSAAPAPAAAPASAATPAAPATGSASPASIAAPASAVTPAAPVTAPAASASATGTAAAAAPAPAQALPDDPAAILRLARAELEAKRAQSALEALDHYLALYPYGNDELFYLYGLAYEQDTPFRNIKKAWESYKRVRDEYPRSARWSAAADRVAYLERHYFGLR